MRVKFIVFCLLLQGWSLFGQVILVYPVRQNHKWGYANAQGKVEIQPKYDAFSDEFLPWSMQLDNPPLSPFRLIESQERVGLIDRALKEILPCKYKRIRPLQNQYFAVETDSLFYIIDQNGATVVADRYEQICAIDKRFEAQPDYFLVKKDGKWGVIDRRGKLIIPTEYAALQTSTGLQFFKVKKQKTDTGWGLINLQNKLLLPFEYADIFVYQENFIVVRKPEGYWFALGADFNPLMSPVWKDVRYLNPHFAVLESEDKTIAPTLWSIPKGSKVIPEERYDQYLALNESYFLCVRDGRMGILDSVARQTIDPRYDSVTLSGVNGLFRIRLQNAWGIYEEKRNRQIVEPRYQLLDYFERGVALMMRSNSLGLVNTKGEEILRATYSQITREADTIKAVTSDGRLSRFILRSSDSLELIEGLNKVRTISIGKRPPQPYMEADLADQDQPGSGRERFYSIEYPNYCANADSSLLWRRNYISKWWELLKRAGGKEYVDKSKSYTDVIRVRARMTAAVYSKDQVIATPFSASVAQLTFRLSKMALYDLNKAQFISDFKYLGIRVTDFDAGLPYAAFVDLDGQMGLIDNAGKELTKPDGTALRYTYIGDFHAGRAPVCVGGVLRLKGGVHARGVGFRTQFMHRFFLREPVPAQYTEADYVRSLVIDSTETSPARWGYMDAKGNVVMEPTLDFAGQFFSDSTAIIIQNGLYGMIDSKMKSILAAQYKSILRTGIHYKIGVPNTKVFYFSDKGHQICDPEYNKYAGFSEGAYAVRKDTKWGFIDTSGKEIVPCRFDTVRAFSGGLAAAVEGDVWVFVNKKGVTVFKTSLPAVRANGKWNTPTLGNFSNGRCRFKNDTWWGYYGPTGDIAIPLGYQVASDFQRGVASVQSRGKYGLIDTSAAWILEPLRFEEIQPFNADGLAIAREKKDGLYGLINTKGDLVTPLKYQRIEKFVKGYAVVKEAKGFGLINHLGKEVIPAQYAKLGPLSEGIVAAQLPGADGRWIYVDTLRQQLGKQSFKTATPFSRDFALADGNLVIGRDGAVQRGSGGKNLFFSEGIFGFELGKKQIYADASGENLFGRSFSEIQAYVNGIGRFRKAGKLGALNRRGVCVIQPKFNFVHIQSDGNLIVRPQQLYGLADKKGKIIIEPQYDRLDRFRGNVFRLELGEKVGYVKPDGKWIWGMGK